MQTKYIPTKIVTLLLLFSVAIATFAPYAWARINTGSEWRGVTPELSYDAMYYYSRANDVTRGHFFVTNPYYFEHRTEPAAISSVNDAIIALPQLLGLSFNFGYYANIFLWSIALLLLSYVLFRALALSPLVSFFGTLWLYAGVYGGMLRPGSMQIIFPLYALFLLFFWRYLNKKDGNASRSEPTKGANLLRGIFPLAIITGLAPYFYIHLFIAIGATLGVYALALLYWRRWADFRQIFFMGVFAVIIVIPHAIHGFSLASQPFYWEALAHNAFTYSHWPQIEAYYYGRWIVLVLSLVYILRRYYPEKITQTTHFFVLFTGLGLLLAMVSNIFTGRDFEIAVHVARFSIFWYLVVGVVVLKPVYLFVFHLRGAWLKRAIALLLFVLLFYQMIANLNRSTAHFSQMKESFVEAQTYAGILDFLKREPESVVLAPEDLNSYISTLTKQYVLYNRYGAHFSVSIDENQERYLLYRAFDRLTESEFIEKGQEHYGPTPSYLARTSALRHRLCSLVRIIGNCPAPETERSFIDSAAMEKKFESYYPDLISRIEEEYARYHVRYIVSKTSASHPLLGTPSCLIVYRDQWFEACQLRNGN